MVMFRPEPPSVSFTTIALAGLTATISSSCSACGEALVEYEKMTAFENWDKTDQGDFELSFQSAPEALSDYEDLLRDELPPLIDELNDALKLPRDMPVKVEDCGEENAFWGSARLGDDPLLGVHRLSPPAGANGQQRS